jgi:multidrug resistance efflux pump
MRAGFSAALHASSQESRQSTEGLDRLEVIAPVDGVLDRVDVQLASSVQRRLWPVATLLLLYPIVAVGEVSERSLGSMNIGGKEQARLVDGRTKDGTICYTSKEANGQTRTYHVEVGPGTYSVQRLSPSPFPLPHQSTE